VGTRSWNHKTKQKKKKKKHQNRKNVKDIYDYVICRVTLLLVVVDPFYLMFQSTKPCGHLISRDTINHKEITRAMKFLDESDIELINQFLNFETSDCQIQGGCDLFATKPVGADRKLYKTIDKQFDALLESNSKEDGDNDNHEIISPSDEFLATKRRFSTSDHPQFSRPQPFNDQQQNKVSTSPRSPETNSPFGPLNETTSRRTFAYLIGILNSSYPDNDYSSLQPSNFLKISFQFLKSKFENTLISLGKHYDELQFIWDLLDDQLDLKNCVCYELLINDDSFFEDYEGGSHSSLWQYKWFIFSKKRKRVGFLYMNGSRLQSPKLYPYQPSTYQPNGTDKRRRLTIDNDLDEEEYDLTYNSDDEKKFQYQDVFEDDGEDDDMEDGYPNVVADDEDTTIVPKYELKA
jgi:hypothetical protein